MSMYLGDFAEDATVHVPWASFGADGASITRATNGTISVYKGNGTTQTTAGITDTEDFDSLTGIHWVTIDTSADAFYATGQNYSVVLSGATIDGETVNAVLATFSIENRRFVTPPTAAAIRTEMDDNSTKFAAIVADTNELQTDWANGGRLDNILDARASQTTADAILDDTGTSGVVVAAGSKSGYALSNTGIDAILARPMPEAYSTPGGDLTVGMALYEIVQHLQAQGITGTTWTIYERDGTTPAFTLTLDDATTPTSAERAT